VTPGGSLTKTMRTTNRINRKKRLRIRNKNRNIPNRTEAQNPYQRLTKSKLLVMNHQIIV